MLTIRQNGDLWDVIDQAGNVLSTFARYELGIAYLSELIAWRLAMDEDEGTDVNGEDAAAMGDGLLAEGWTSSTGIAFSEPTGDGRDFTGCVWTSRDPAVYPLPLMLQTGTDIGHFGAELAGFMDECDTSGTTPTGSGRFYDCDAGEQFRNLLLGGRRFGVSVDPGPGTDAEFHCTEFDDDGWCNDGDLVFMSYEIIGLTGTPFPGFANATIELETFLEGPMTMPAAPEPAAAAPADDSAESAVAGSARSLDRTHLAAPPRAWFDLPEPDVGQTGLVDLYGMPVEELLVEQPDGTLAVPLTITAEGQVFGHLAQWGQPHVGYPDQRVTVPESMSAYAHFHVGATDLDDGSQIPTGNLVVGCDHAELAMGWAAARDAYAHAGLGWARVRASNGALGCWIAGALRPAVTDAQVSLLRELALSGDWRSVDGGPLELIAGLAVNVPGFPIARESITAAAGLPSGVAAAPRLGARLRGGEPVALVASGIVRRCSECEKQRRLRAQGDGRPQVVSDPRMLTLLQTLERRTRHLVPDAIAAAAARVKR